MSDFDTSSTNAMVWAEAFCAAMVENDWTTKDIDDGLMVGWFANYWAAVHDPLQKRIEELEAAVCDHDWLQYDPTDNIEQCQTCGLYREVDTQEKDSAT